MKTILVTILMIPTLAFAALGLDQVDKVDTNREGNLQELVLKFYKDNHQKTCDDTLSMTAELSIIKLSSGSNNDTKLPGTTYSYDAIYLVSQKCMYGTTYQGAYKENVKNLIIKASFNSSYNENKGPAKIESLKIEVKSELAPVELYQYK